MKKGKLYLVLSFFLAMSVSWHSYPMNCQINFIAGVVEKIQKCIDTVIKKTIINIEVMTEVILSKVCELDLSVGDINVEVSGIEDIILNISRLEEILCSKLEIIESKVDDIDINISVLDDTLCSKLEVIESKIDDVDIDISVLDDTLCSKLEIIESKIDNVNIDVSVLGENLCSKLEIIESKVDNVDLDVSVLTDIVCSKFEYLDSKIDIILADISQVEDVLCSKLEVIESKIDYWNLCSKTPITTQTTITEPGNYCLANDITGSITILSSRVQLCLNNREVGSGIDVGPGLTDVTIENGTVLGGSPGILVQAGTSGVTIRGVLVKNASAGIQFEQVSDGLIDGCSLASNVTGLFLNSSHKINVQDTVASCNSQVGFELLSSSTNTFENCKALSTGEGNTRISNNNVFGFVSKDGFGNIFENNIANGTRGEFTTDSASLIAGFALRGTEKCTKIIGSEAANATASIAGGTVPHGILLESTFAGEINQKVLTADDTCSVDWSPDGKYIARGGAVTSGANVFVEQFDRSTETTTLVASVLTSDSNTVYSVNWSPSGRYLAVGTSALSPGTGGSTSDVTYTVYTFCAVNNSLTKVADVTKLPAVTPLDAVGARVVWHTNENYIAVIFDNASSPLLNPPFMSIYRLDRVKGTLTLTDTETVANLKTIDWSPDGAYIAAGSYSATQDWDLSVYSFDEATGQITLAQSVTFLNTLGSLPFVNAIRWSPNGQYIAIGVTSNTIDLVVYQFDRSSNSLTEILSQSVIALATIFDFSWSSDGRYLGAISNVSEIFFYLFQPESGSVELLLQDFLGAQFNTMGWSPDGQYIAVGGCAGLTSARFAVYDAIQFASKNVIKDNTVYCNGHDVMSTFTGAVGVGISGSSISNMIIGNTAYNNPPFTNNFFIGTNYAFVTNVFDQRFGQIPSDLQNISVDGCQPICTPIDVGLVAKQILDKVCNDLPSQIDNITVNVSNVDVTVNTDFTSVIDAISIQTEILCSKIDNISVGDITVDVDVDFTSILDAISISDELLCSKLNVIESKIDNIDISCPDFVCSIGDVNVDFTTVLDAISEQTEILCSKIDNINISIPDIVVNVTFGDIIAECDLTSVLDAISISDELLCSKLNVIESKIDNLDISCPDFVCSIGDVNVDFTTVLDAISVQTEVLCSKIDNISIGDVVVDVDVDFTSILDAISASDVLICSKIDALRFSTTDNPCAPTPIFASTTITAEGHYCLANNITDGPITIASSNVDLDLNDLAAKDGIIVNGSLDQITIHNGTVESGSSLDGIRVNSGTTNVTIEKVTVKDSLRGIHFDGVSGGLIDSVSLTQNSTGLFFQNTHKIKVSNSVATSNTYAGFDLVFSNSNCIIDSKAINTGQNNTDASATTVFGFASSFGYGNIFERNIANGTQAPLATDCDSVVAGFILRGSECCTKIIDSESANTTTNSAGYVVPYGILLEDTLDPLTTQTNTTLPGSQINTVDWSGDGAYLAIGGAQGVGDNEVWIFKSDRLNDLLTLIVSIDYGSTVNALEWSPDGMYIAIVGASGEIQIYEFDRCSCTATLVDSKTYPYALKTVSWTPDGKWLAVGAINPNFPTSNVDVIGLYEFNPIRRELTQRDSVEIRSRCNIDDPFDVFKVANICSVDWSPDGRFLAAGGQTIGNNPPEVFVFEIDYNTRTLVCVSDIQQDGDPYTLKWSKQGKFLIVGGERVMSGGNNSLRLFAFDKDTKTLDFNSSVNQDTGFDVRSLDCSTEGKYIVVVGDSNDIKVYEFDLCSSSFNELQTVTYGANLKSVSWSPDGRSIAVGGELNGDVSAQLYSALTFPSKNVIKGNTVYCNSGGVCPDGVGLSGSSLCNMIIGNVAYNNPVNYAYVTNVFDNRSSNGPTDIQNIAMEGCEGLPLPENIACLVKQVREKVCDIQSRIEGVTVNISSLDVTVDVDFTSVLDAISQQTEILCSKIDNISVGDITVDVDVDLTSVLDAISISDGLICSKLNVIESKIDNIDFSCPDFVCSIGDVTVDVDFTSVLDAISQQTEILCSKIDNISIGDVTVDVDVDFTSVLDAISVQTEVLCSKIDNISIGDVNVDVDFTTVLDALSQQTEILCSKIDNISIGDVNLDVDLTSVLDAISASQEVICSKLEIIDSQIDVVDSVIEIIESKVCKIDSQLDVIESKIDDIDVDISILGDTLCSKLEVVEDNLCSKLEIIDSKVDIIESTNEIILSKVCQMDSQLDVIESKLDSPCAATVIMSAPTTISDPGNYCLANNVTGDITIDASDVNLDMNNRRVQGSIAITSGREHVTIENGIVEGTASTDGITVASGATAVTIDNVTVKDAMRGIHFDGASNSNVSNVSLVQNTTGLQLESSYKVNVDNAVASCNVQAGFDLIGSSTNSVINSKALSTGEGNTNIFDNNVFGFVSTDGFGNIFENNIANATQALTTTDANSVVAGFALRGSEGCSKIIGSESANATASGEGVTIPYGILLEGTVQEQTFTTQAEALSSGTVNSTVWSPDGKYVAVGGVFSGDDSLQIFTFDRVSNELRRIASIFSGTIHSISWRADGTYLAVGGESLDGGDNQFHILSFDKTTNQLKSVASDLTGTVVTAVSWGPEGNYVAVGTNTSSVDLRVRIYSFNSVVNEIQQKAVEATPINVGSELHAVTWSPDGEYIAICGQSMFFPSTTESLQIYQFNKETNVLAFSTSACVLSDEKFSVAWSSRGDFIALVGVIAAQGDLSIFFFNRNDDTISVVADGIEATGGTFVRSVDWSADGNYLAVGGEGITTGLGRQFQILAFDYGDYRLTPLVGGLNEVVRSISWSPDGAHIAVGGNGMPGNQFVIVNGLTFPSKNVVKDNTVYCNGHDVSATFTGAVGVGISGSSISNMIIGNTAYNNPPTSSNFFVPSNYYFVTNVFNQLFGQAPTALQNISLDGCDPICTPEDLGLLAKQILYKVCDTIPSQLDVIESKIDALTFSVEDSPCGPTAILAAPTTISIAGNYCLANDVMGDITITANDVDLDMNNRRVTGSINVSGARKRVTIENGIVDGDEIAADGIAVGAGSSEITINNVTVEKAMRGIHFDTVSNSVVENVTLSQNGTGLTLENSYKVNISDSVAACNTQIGFELIASSTNCIVSSKALSTGEGNTREFENDVFGFVSTNGSGNIFERCIANATQALSTTDCQSLVAGFALRGSERCTKIIENESANAVISEVGVTIPYGILLEDTLSQLTTVTGDLPDASCTLLRWFAWSPDGRYVAVAGDLIGNGSKKMQIYSFNRISKELTYLTGVITNCDVASIDWACNDYIAIGGSALTADNELQLFKFERVSCSLERIAGALGTAGDVSAVAWSPDGKFLAVGGTQLTSYQLQILKFDKIAETLTQVAGLFAGSEVVNSVDWSPDGSLLVVGGCQLATNQLQVYSFTPGTYILTLLDGALGASPEVTSAKWSPDGYYIAVAGDDIPSNELNIFRFDRASNTLSLVDAALGTGGIVSVVDWSANGKYVAVGGCSLATAPQEYDPLQVYKFDRGVEELQFIDGTLTSTAGEVINLAWSPDGEYIAAGGMNLPNSNQFQLIGALEFPSKNVIIDNTVYCNGSVGSATKRFGGVGIAGSSVSNLIVGNTSYNNPAADSDLLVGSNYLFVTNIFDPLCQSVPSKLQNISIDGCTPITPPEVGGTETKQIRNKTIIIQSMVEDLTAKIGCPTDIGTCLPTLIDVPEDINNLDLNVIQLLKTILLQFYGCNEGL